jgi:hypothetical protein
VGASERAPRIPDYTRSDFCLKTIPKRNETKFIVSDSLLLTGITTRDQGLSLGVVVYLAWLGSVVKDLFGIGLSGD